ETQPQGFVSRQETKCLREERLLILEFLSRIACPEEVTQAHITIARPIGDAQRFDVFENRAEHVLVALKRGSARRDPVPENLAIGGVELGLPPMRHSARLDQVDKLGMFRMARDDQWALT